MFYSHLAEQWVAKREVGPTPGVDFVDALTSDPMHMGLQGIGQIAVPFFFLVSGFVVTPIALRQGQRGFGLNRLVRVYVPMTFVVLLTAAVILLGARTLVGAEEPAITWWTVLTNSLVVNYLIVPQVVMVGVAWTLVVEVVFYVLLVLLLPVMKRWTWLAIGVQLTFVFVVMMSAREFGASWALFAVNVSYLPIPIIGQVIWATTSKRVPLWLGGVFVGVAWSLYVLAEHLELGRLDTSYNLALAFALLCFLVGYFAESRLKERRIWIALSERSYSIYLLHGLVAFVVLDLIRPAVPLLLAIPIAVALTFGVVELSYRYVEKPSHALARRLARRPAPVPAPAVESEDEDEDEIEDDLDPESEFEDHEPDDEPDDERDHEPEPVREDPTEVLPVIRQTRRRPPPRSTPPPPRSAPPQRTPTSLPPVAPPQRTPVPPRPVAPRPTPPPPRPVEDPTRYIAAVWPTDDEPEPEEAPRRRRLREDSTPAVTVASLLANHARENGHGHRR